MNLAKVYDNGNITVPTAIRRTLGIKSGDKILFFQNANGEIVMQNTSAMAIKEAQDSIAGSHFSEEDTLADVMETRYGAVNT